MSKEISSTRSWLMIEFSVLKQNCLAHPKSSQPTLWNWTRFSKLHFKHILHVIEGVYHDITIWFDTPLCRFGPGCFGQVRGIQTVNLFESNKYFLTSRSTGGLARSAATSVKLWQVFRAKTTPYVEMWLLQRRSSERRMRLAFGFVRFISPGKRKMHSTKFYRFVREPSHRLEYQIWIWGSNQVIRLIAYGCMLLSWDSIFVSP